MDRKTVKDLSRLCSCSCWSLSSPFTYDKRAIFSCLPTLRTINNVNRCSEQSVTLKNCKNNVTECFLISKDIAKSPQFKFYSNALSNWAFTNWRYEKRMPYHLVRMRAARPSSAEISLRECLSHCSSHQEVSEDKKVCLRKPFSVRTYKCFGLFLYDAAYVNFIRERSPALQEKTTLHQFSIFFLDSILYRKWTKTIYVKLTGSMLVSLFACLSYYYPKYWDRCAFVLFVLRFYDPVNPVGTCRPRSVYLTIFYWASLVL